MPAPTPPMLQVYAALTALHGCVMAFLGCMSLASPILLVDEPAVWFVVVPITVWGACLTPTALVQLAAAFQLLRRRGRRLALAGNAVAVVVLLPLVLGCAPPLLTIVLALLGPVVFRQPDVERWFAEGSAS